MASYIALKLRQIVAERAAYRCEYCLTPQIAKLKHQPDHILPRQHGGLNTVENLALSCQLCNHYKGPNIGSYDPETGEFAPFSTRAPKYWEEHFRLEGTLIRPLTAEARVTARILRFDDPLRVAERGALLRMGLYG